MVEVRIHTTIINSLDSPVFTPKDGNRWLLAKQLYQLADFGYVEMVEHLLKTHMILQPICIIAKRTISEFHPLGQLFKWHCRGLIVTNVNGFPRLLLPEGYMHTLFSMGHVGSMELLNRAYKDYSWKDTDFWENIKVSAFMNTLLNHSLFIACCKRNFNHPPIQAFTTKILSLFRNVAWMITRSFHTFLTETMVISYGDSYKAT